MKNLKKTTKAQASKAPSQTVAFAVRSNVRAGGLSSRNHNRSLA